jgi:hypothetical protein
MRCLPRDADATIEFGSRIKQRDFSSPQLLRYSCKARAGPPEICVHHHDFDAPIGLAAMSSQKRRQLVISTTGLQ